MLSLYALIAIFAIFVILIIFTFATKSSKGLDGVIISGMLLLFTFVAVSIANSNVNARISYMYDTYDNLMLYHETVEASTNEYVRFDYHEKVKAYNAAYDVNLAESEGAVFGWLFPTGWDDGLDYIDFQLHGDDYGEGH